MTYRYRTQTFSLYVNYCFSLLNSYMFCDISFYHEGHILLKIMRVVKSHRWIDMFQLTRYIL